MEKAYSEVTAEGLTLLELEGKIMGGPRSRQLCDRIRELVAGGQKHVILDLSKVRWINSTGIGAILTCVTSVRREGGDLHFTGLQERMSNYFKMIRLDTILRIYESRAQALQAVAAKT